MSDRVRQIEQRLRDAFAPSVLQVRDDSAKHEGHVGARDGRGHFHVTICSTRFAQQSLIARHRAIYAALGSLMQSDIHALSIQASAPDGQA
jgi:BolA family transcriptional regulator, general stress-responsive regulator